MLTRSAVAVAVVAALGETLSEGEGEGEGGGEGERERERGVVSVGERVRRVLEGSWVRVKGSADGGNIRSHHAGWNGTANSSSGDSSSSSYVLMCVTGEADQRQV